MEQSRDWNHHLPQDHLLPDEPTVENLSGRTGSRWLRPAPDPGFIIFGVATERWAGPPAGHGMIYELHPHPGLLAQTEFTAKSLRQANQMLPG